jgi:crossover junction endodeoxyribonuclease RusA
MPITVNVEVAFLLLPPDKRQRDLDNYLKALLNSLTHADVWEEGMQIRNLSQSGDENLKMGK